MNLTFASPLGRFPINALRAARQNSRCATRPRWYASTGSTVNKAISDNNVMVFSASYCPYCMRVKSLFADLNVDHTVWELDERDDGDDIKGFLLEKTGQRTVPNVFVKGSHVGGCDGKLHAVFLYKIVAVTNEDNYSFHYRHDGSLPRGTAAEHD
ncbi:glutaredoxin [Gracilaria domingensis]|nr:glutaredoxin [Gracilaria domingensis]